ncbi:hypothetical protein TCAL_15165, partial [Tigriopus californicus]
MLRKASAGDENHNSARPLSSTSSLNQINAEIFINREICHKLETSNRDQHGNERVPHTYCASVSEPWYCTLEGNEQGNEEGNEEGNEDNEGNEG